MTLWKAEKDLIRVSLVNLGAVSVAALMRFAAAGMLASVAIASTLTVATGTWALRSVFFDDPTQSTRGTIAKTEPDLTSRIARFSLVVWGLVLLDRRSVGQRDGTGL